MTHVTAATALRCKECERTTELTAAYVCEYCFGPLEVTYDMERIAATVTRERIAAGPHSLWRYRDFLPCSPEDVHAGLPTGMTPLVKAPRLAEALGLGEVWVKNDTANPTHSFKDRVVSVALEKAKQLGYSVVACASTGNLANSVAAHASAHGLRELRLRPGRPRGAEDRRHGGLRHQADGGRRQLRRRQPALHGAGQRPPLGLRQRQRAPLLREGSKTLAYEVAEQLGWTLPDRCIVPIASGSLYTKINRGFRDLLQTGLVEGEVPVLNGAQAAGCGPVAAAYEAGLDFVAPVRPTPSPRASRSATRPTASSPWTSRAPPAARSRPSPRRRSSRASSCSPAPPASSPRPPAA